MSSDQPPARPWPNRITEPRRDRRHRTTIPVSIHGRSLAFAIICAIAAGFTIVFLATRVGRGKPREAAASPGPLPTVAIASPAPAPAPAPPAPPPAVEPPPPTAPLASPPPAAPAPVAATAGKPRLPRTSGPATATAPKPSTTPTTAAEPPPSVDSKDPLVKARGLLAAGETGGAIKLVEQELAVTPGRPALYDVLGDARNRTGNRIAAIAAYRRYLALVGDTDDSDRTKRVRAKLAKLGGI